MKAFLICENLLDAIINEQIVEGKVHSVFKSACNMETRKGLVTLLSSDRNMAPMSILVDNHRQVNFIDIGIRKDLKFVFSENVIYNTEKNILIELNNVRSWYSGVLIKAPKCTEKEILENIKVLEEELGVYGKFHGIGWLISALSDEVPELQLRHFCICPYKKALEFIKCRFIQFIRDLLKCDWRQLGERGESIIGYGPGLTPAMDDFISGLMISFIYFGNCCNLSFSSICELNKKIISSGLDRTTRISAEMLRHSAVGETNDAVRKLLTSLIACKDRKVIVSSLLNTIDYGETSGTDTVLGIYVGSKILTNIAYRKNIGGFV
ncbi:oxamate carbamoyltransferase subunit AllH family protein [Clostridium sp. JNZ X4-2]